MQQAAAGGRVYLGLYVWQLEVEQALQGDSYFYCLEINTGQRAPGPVGSTRKRVREKMKEIKHCLKRGG